MTTLGIMAPEATMADAVPRRRVLLAEDDGALLELLTEFLELQGLEVVAVASGDVALRALAEQAAPDLAVLDLRMPGAPGDEVLRRMRSHPRWSRIPVVAMTGLRPDEVGLLARPDELLSKPFDMETLSAAIARLCSAPRERGRH